MKVECNRCGKKFKENWYIYIEAHIFTLGRAKFICPKCYSKKMKGGIKTK